MAQSADPIKAWLGATWIVRVLREHEHTAYFAGGCVRDGLLGLHPTDYDVATDATPQRVRELFPRTAEVGAAFGVVLVRVPGQELGAAPGVRGEGVTVEVATFRSDGPYSDARRPDRVHFSDSRADAERRDFTINALFCDPMAESEAPISIGPETKSDIQGKIIDYVGGVEDLKRRVIRAVGNADKRLAEDHLRALRAVRFAARLGFAIDPGTSAAMVRHAVELRGVSRERIGEELRRMLSHPARADALRLLQEHTLDAPVLNEPNAKADLRIVAALSKTGQRVRMSTLLGAWAVDRVTAAGSAPAWLPAPAQRDLVRRWRGALCLSNDETTDLGDVLDTAWVLAHDWPKASTAVRKRIAHKRIFDNVLQLLAAADPEAGGAIAQEVHSLRQDGVGLGPEPLLTGDDLVAGGRKPGPRFKGVLEQVYDAQLEGKVRTKAEAMELAGRLYV